MHYRCEIENLFYLFSRISLLVNFVTRTKLRNFDKNPKVHYLKFCPPRFSPGKFDSFFIHTWLERFVALQMAHLYCHHIIQMFSVTFDRLNFPFGFGVFGTHSSR